MQATQNPYTVKSHSHSGVKTPKKHAVEC